MKTITRADVAETIYEEIGLSRKDSNDILDTRNCPKETMLSFLLSELLPCATKRRVPDVIPKPGLLRKFLPAGLFLLSPLKP